MSRVPRHTRSRAARAVTVAAAVETLESRRLLSCDVDVYGDTLLIRGDRSDNEISVSEENGVWTVVCDGHAEPLIDADIDKLVIKSSKGNDDVDVELENDGGQIEEVEIDTSDGHDEVNLQIGPNLVDANGEVTLSHGGGDWHDYHGGEDDLEIDISLGSGNDTLNANITLFRGDENGGGPPVPVSGAAAAGTAVTASPRNRIIPDPGEQRRGLELDVDAGSGNDTVAANVLVVNGDDFGVPRALGGERSGADGGDGDGNIDIEIDLGSGHDDLTLRTIVLNLLGDILPLSGGSNHGGGGGGHEEDLEIDIEGGSGDDDIDVDIAIVNRGIFSENATSGGGSYGDDDHEQDGITDVDLDLDIDGGSGNDNISVEVNTTPFFPGGLEPLGDPTPPIASPRFGDVEMTIDGESGNDAVDVLVVFANNILAPTGIEQSGPLAPVNIDIEGGSGHDDLRVEVRANGARLVDSNGDYGDYNASGGGGGYWGKSRRDPFIRLEGESGNDDLTLLVFQATVWHSGASFLLHGGSGFDTCTTNVDEEDVKIISCEDHNEPL